MSARTEMNKKYFLAFIVLILTGYFYVNSNIGKPNSPVQYLKNYLPEDLVRFFKESLFVSSNQNLLQQELAARNTESQTLKILNHQLKEKEKILIDLSSQLPILEFVRNEEAQYFRAGKQNYQLVKFSTNQLVFGKHPGSTGSSYLGYFDGNLIIVSATGLIGYVNVREFAEDKFTVTTIPSNIREIITYDDFYGVSSYGIKDLLVYDKQLYISFTNQVAEDCFNTSILVSELHLDKLVFKAFFTPTMCVSTDNTYGEFNPHQSGGRMVPYKDHQILFSTGEYRLRELAQDESNVFGKIIAIDIRSKEFELISVGHRNPQGLHYLDKEDILLSTEHGPQGGDEINIHLSPGRKLENYGWPIASYGEHYGFHERDDNHPKYQKAPLFKSHSDYGFSEPVKYFTPSIAISEIVKIPSKFCSTCENLFLVAAMGSGAVEDSMSIHQIQFDVDFTPLDSSIIPLNERVRDMIYIEELNKVLLFLETTASIGILELN